MPARIAPSSFPEGSPAWALEQLVDHLRHGAPMPDMAKSTVIDAIDEFLANPGEVQIDQALGLRRRGGVSASRARVLADRDQLLRRLQRVVRGWNDMAPAAAARLMVIDAARYEAARWPRERHALSEPGAEPAATWWHILRSEAPMPGTARLAQILREKIQ